MNKKSNVIVGATVLVVIGLAVAGFSVFGGHVKEEAVKQVAAVQEVEIVTVGTGSFVASKQGKKYFPVDCGTAKAIKEENKVYFGSEGEAQAAGYERSLTCK